MGALHPGMCRERSGLGFSRSSTSGFQASSVSHTCPGWKECSELKEVWRELQLDWVEFGFKNRHVDYILLPVVFRVVMAVFVFVTTSGIPANWRMWPQIHLYP